MKTGPTFSTLTNRNFRLYLIGLLLSNIGTWMQRVAQDWLVLELTDSGSALGITTALQIVPVVLLAPIAGTIADRFPKRRLLALTQVTMGSISALLAILAIGGWVAAWHVYVLAFLFGCAGAVDMPARQAFLHEMVGADQTPNAVALGSAAMNTARMIAPALAGLMIAAMGSGVRATGWVILINAVSYVAVLASLARMRADELIATPRLTSARGHMRDALAYVAARPDILLVMGTVFCVGTFGMNFQITTALMATDAFGKGAGEFGVLGSTLAIGSLLGSLLAARRREPRQRLVVVAALLFGGIEVVAGLMPSYLAFAVMLPLCGVTSMLSIVAATTFVQMAAPPQIRGRMMALYMAIFMAGTPIGSPLLGLISDHAGARWTLIGGGSLTIVGTVIVAMVFARPQGVALRSAWRPPLRMRVGRPSASSDSLTG